FGGTSVRRNDVKSGNKCPVPKKKTYRNNAELILTILLSQKNAFTFKVPTPEVEKLFIKSFEVVAVKN
ncbi:MAG: hypothetical protein JWQ09_2439, partial [Segetibacter sp.]|nr:hypothetical protein [Segetibacter sp.]